MNHITLREKNKNTRLHILTFLVISLVFKIKNGGARQTKRRYATAHKLTKLNKVLTVSDALTEAEATKIHHLDVHVKHDVTRVTKTVLADAPDCAEAKEISWRNCKATVVLQTTSFMGEKQLVCLKVGHDLDPHFVKMLAERDGVEVDGQLHIACMLETRYKNAKKPNLSLVCKDRTSAYHVFQVGSDLSQCVSSTPQAASMNDDELFAHIMDAIASTTKQQVEDGSSTVGSKSSLVKVEDGEKRRPVKPSTDNIVPTQSEKKEDDEKDNIKGLVLKELKALHGTLKQLKKDKTDKAASAKKRNSVKEDQATAQLVKALQDNTKHVVELQSAMVDLQETVANMHASQESSLNDTRVDHRPLFYKLNNGQVIQVVDGRVLGPGGTEVEMSSINAPSINQQRLATRERPSSADERRSMSTPIKRERNEQDSSFWHCECEENAIREIGDDYCKDCRTMQSAKRLLRK